MASDDPTVPSGPTADGDGWRTGLQRWRERLAPSEGPWYRRLWIPLILGAIGIAAVGAVAALFTVFYVAGSVPPPDDLVIPEPTVVLDSDEEEVATLEPGAVRRNVDLADLPDHVPDAVLAAEDRDFYEHGGFSPRSIGRAFIANLRAGEIREGASTITQQYVSIAVVDTPQTYTGKLQEVALARRLEREADKDTILEMYLNSVPLGRAAIGIEAGAQVHFDKSAAELEVNEAATLAGIIAAPSAFDPRRDPGAADVRRIFVLEGMAERGWLDDDEAQELIDAGLPEIHEGDLVHFGSEAYYLDSVRRELDGLLDGEDTSLGYRIVTAMDSDLQEAAQSIVTSHVADEEYSGAIVSIDNDSGAVRVLVGGPDFEDQSFNAAIQGQRQTGSAFKTFGLAAFLHEGYSPESRFPAPAEEEVEFDGHEDYEVSNFGDIDYGEQTVRQATATSTNTVFIQMAAEVTPEAVQEIALRTGISEEAQELHAFPSLVLGTAEVTVLNFTETYATLASDGVHRRPFLIERIEHMDTGATVFEAEPEETETIDESLARQVTDVLRGVIEGGTGTAAQIGRPAAGKTGTTDEHRDAWFAGYVPQMTTTVWVGNLDNTPMADVTGGSVPAAMWSEYMSQAVEGVDVADFPAADFTGMQQLDEVPEPTPTPEPDPSPTPDPTPTPEPDPTPTPEPDPSPTPPDDDDDPDPDPTPTPPGDDDDNDDEDDGEDEQDDDNNDDDEEEDDD